jgi:endonuclease YncB( thermonuclease family)
MRDRRGAVVCLAACLWLMCLAVGWADRWWTYKRCRFAVNPANDGDSFHVQTKSDHFIYRLYFVDAPETDDLVPDRVKEQMDYWDVSRDELFEAAAEAKAFTSAFLEKRFTVHSKREDAQGRSKLPRYYAIVTAKDGRDLALAMVENGLARVKGFIPSDLPDDGNPRKTASALRAAEREAKRERKGIWRLSGTSLAERQTGSRNAVEPRDVVLSGRVAVYADDGAMRIMGFLQPGATVHVLERVAHDYVRVRFDTDGRTIEGRCRFNALDLNVP